MKPVLAYLFLAYLALAYVVVGLILVALAASARELRNWRTWLVILFWPVDVILEIMTLLRERRR